RLRRSQAQGDLAGRGAQDFRENGQLADDGVSRRVHRQRAGRPLLGFLIGRARSVCRRLLRRREQREKSADEGPGPRLSQVEVPGILTVQEIGYDIGGRGLVETQQHIIVPVEYWNWLRHHSPDHATGPPRIALTTSR